MNELKIAYEVAFSCFRKGEYYRQGGRRLKGNTHRPFSEKKAHKATLEYLLYLWCDQHGRSDHKQYFKIIHLITDNSISLKEISLKDVFNFCENG